MTLKWKPIKEEHLKRDLIGYQVTANGTAVGDVLESGSTEVTLDKLVPQNDVRVGVVPVMKGGVKSGPYPVVRVSDLIG